ncbi:MAG: MFS transporter [Gemmatimonadetes bacterium]|jgi:MFS transporter, DHA3 family, macrolide efflux protein|nr:MFS transporter [Gemmatimonadota bacterium]
MEGDSAVRPVRWAVPFFIIWTGQALSLVGTRIGQFALVWWVTETTGSATILATATMMAILPGVLGGPFAGALVDRWSRRRVMIVADGFIALVGAWVAYLFWSGTMEVWHIYVVVVARAVGEIFHGPAMQASTSLMVPQEHLPRVAGINQTLYGGLNVVAPPLGALLLSVLPMHEIMAIDVVTAGFAILPLFFIHVPQPQREDGGASGVLTDVREGLRYIWRWTGLRGLCVLAMVLNFIVSPAVFLMPILVTRHFGGEALQLGWLNSAWGAGLVLGGLLLGTWGGFKRRATTMLVGIIGLGVGLVVVAATPSDLFPLALAGLFFGAVMNALCNGSAMALMQQVVAPQIQGRVFTVVGSLCGGMMPLSMAIAGPLADQVGIRWLFLVGGAAQILMGLGAFRVRSIMGIESQVGAGFQKGEVGGQAGD